MTLMRVTGIVVGSAVLFGMLGLTALAKPAVPEGTDAPQADAARSEARPKVDPFKGPPPSKARATRNPRRASGARDYLPVKDFGGY
jgi:hypothetical protein